jgi:hypothetical protein
LSRLLQFSHSGPDDLPDKNRWQWFSGPKPNRAFGRFVAGQIRGMGADYCGTHWMQAAVIGRGGKASERPAVQPEPRQTVAEALFRMGRCGSDVLAQFLQRRSFVCR